MQGEQSVLKTCHLGLSDYRKTWESMRQWTLDRNEATADQCWIVQHNPVFTLGLSGNKQHILATGDIPVVQSDRGGQVTYHGPGQLVFYPLLDIKRLGLSVSELVHLLESMVIEWFKYQEIDAQARSDAPGVYVNGAKIASLGLRIKRGRSYHGLSLNVDMDLEPFSRINPCGYAGMPVTQVVDLGLPHSLDKITLELQSIFARRLGYTNCLQIQDIE
ncbi:MAG: lipoyl(octanoyl) transferase LipB [Gammaproteobacteria bacterium]